LKKEDQAMKARHTTILMSLLFGLQALPADAHTGAVIAEGYASGLLHPLLGMDHLLVMMGVGLWSGLSGGKARWLLPALFLTMMAAGAGLSFAGLPMQAAEKGVVLSLPALGVMLSGHKHIHRDLFAAGIGFFALLHGFVHAEEIEAGVESAPYVAGFLTGTASLLGLGVVASRLSSAMAGMLQKLYSLICIVAGMALMAGA
jgi:urease accessory protein